MNVIAEKESWAQSASFMRIRSYFELLKARLSMLVAFSACFGYLLGLGTASIDWFQFLGLAFGGFLLSGASVTLNQIMEVNEDRKMKRTQNRPLPLSKLSKQDALVYAFVLLGLSLTLLYFVTNLLVVVISFVSFLLYCFAYTPLKKVGSIAVLVGAIPGALPPLIGWVAATGQLSHAAMIIFGIQFIWQFPHFWAIAWVADEDYKRAGFKLLPAGGRKDLNTAIQIMVYTLFLIPLSLLPAQFGLTGLKSAIVATICGVLFLSQTFLLMRDGSRKSALKIMYSSFIYLPVIQIAYLLDMS